MKNSKFSYKNLYTDLILEQKPSKNNTIIKYKNILLTKTTHYKSNYSTIYFDEISGIKITKYIEDVFEYETCPYEDKIERCAQLMKKLHTLSAPNFPFEPFKTLETYRSLVKKPLFDLSIYEESIKEVQSFKNKDVLCHNDFVSGNILYGKDRDYLIDYEYAAANDPLFDVMSFLSENQIFDKDLRMRFYNVYFEEINEEIMHQLYLWEMFQNVLWCNWAMMMYESRKENIYKEIAESIKNSPQYENVRKTLEQKYSTKD